MWKLKKIQKLLWQKAIKYKVSEFFYTQRFLKLNNVIDSVSYDQYKNIPTAEEMGIKTKIIFS